LALQCLRERCRQEKLTIVNTNLTLVAEIEHAPALPVVIGAFVSRLDLGAISTDVGDYESFDFAKRIDLHRERNHKPIVTIDQSQLSKQKQQLIGRLRVEIAEVNLLIFHLPEARIRHAFECRGRREE